VAVPWYVLGAQQLSSRYVVLPGARESVHAQFLHDPNPRPHKRSLHLSKPTRVGNFVCIREVT